MTQTSPERLLEGLNDAQGEAVRITTGPLAIIAGAGSGKTRVISHRAAYAIETAAVRTDQILLVTFTDKAATEMVERMRALGHPGVMARTFHAMALSQLRHFWPSRHGGEPVPSILDAKWRILSPLARRLPGGYKFTTVKDLAETIEWAKVRRIPPERWTAEGGDRAPIPADLFRHVYADYERAKARAGAIDFEDMLVETVRLLETDADAAELVRSRKSWFSVDEYQDTNPLAERLMELWLGGSRDLAVVGDPDQTIYSFTGATPAYLLGFAARYPGARTVALVENYRSTPQILELANRLIAAAPRSASVVRGPLRATRPAGPAPTVRRYADSAGELAALISTMRNELRNGTDAAEIAVLVRINAQLPEIEQALTRASIPFQVRGQRFFARREVADARRLLRGSSLRETGATLVATIRQLFTDRLGLGAEAEAAGDEARERAASLELLVDIAQDLASTNAALTAADVVAELDRRDAEEASGSSAGVNLLTYHRAKGLEWDAVFLPALEEGLLPIRQAKEDDEVAEEQRLLYVGITRARRLLALSWAQRREGAGGKETQRRPSRFLAALEDPSVRAARRVTVLAGAPIAARRAKDDDSPLMAALRAWRLSTARSDGVSAFIVAPDSLLLEIADQRPTTVAALRRVKGMGSSRLSRYGEEMLEIVRGATA